jgi:hypothetical protein
LFFAGRKVDVNGEDAAPIYKFLKSSKTGPMGEDIKWNFAKFLVDRQGHVAERYAPTTYPLSIQVSEEARAVQLPRSVISCDLTTALTFLRTRRRTSRSCSAGAIELNIRRQ